MRKMIATWLGICMMFICSITVTAKTLTSDNMPENLPQKYHSMQYSVLADGQEVGVYNVGNNAWGQEVSNCQLISDKSVKLTIDTAFNFSEFTVLPRTANASYTQNGRSIEVICRALKILHLSLIITFKVRHCIYSCKNLRQKYRKKLIVMYYISVPDIMIIPDSLR